MSLAHTMAALPSHGASTTATATSSTVHQSASLHSDSLQEQSTLSSLPLMPVWGGKPAGKSKKSKKSAKRAKEDSSHSKVPKQRKVKAASSAPQDYKQHKGTTGAHLAARRHQSGGQPAGRLPAMDRSPGKTAHAPLLVPKLLPQNSSNGNSNGSNGNGNGDETTTADTPATTATANVPQQALQPDLDASCLPGFDTLYVAL